MSVIRLNNGGAIQVRTGVLQGVGPVGPQGVQGMQGPEGPVGPDGPTGPMGAITEFLTKATVGSATSVSADTDTMVSFANVTKDDLSAATSSTNFTLGIGVYQLNAWVRFDMPANAGDGARALWIRSTTMNPLARNQIVAVADDATYLSVTWTDYFANAGEVINVYARSGDDLSVGVSAGALTITRIGSGPAGAAGPQGPAGPVGPAGPQGPAGPSGSASSGFTTYGDLLP